MAMIDGVPPMAITASPAHLPLWRGVAGRLPGHALLWRRMCHRYILDLLAQQHPRPSFILGHQKSGTSVIAGLLGQMCGITVAIDMKRDVHHPAFQLVQSGDLSFDGYRKRNALEFSRDVIKECNLTPMLGQLLTSYPESRYVFVVRDPRDSIRSILQRLGLPGDPNEMPSDGWRSAVSDAWELVLDGTWLGTSGEDYVDGLARRWQLFANIYAHYRDRLIAVRYEDFLSNKAGTIATLAGRLGHDARYDISHLVNVQYQHKGDTSISLHEFFKRRYILNRIEHVCADGMQMFGYNAALSVGGSSS